jgi:Na+/melibiose symporter-like transporter
MIDILAFAGLDWLYDRIEGRYGRGVAWLVTFALGLSILGILVWVLSLVLSP